MQEHIKTLNVAELFIRQKISLAEASPFLAHCSLKEAERAKFSNSFAAFIQADAARISEAFRRWPLVSVWNFANALSECYGEDGHAVYRVLNQTFSVNLAGETREQISRSFKEICRKFGLCYVGSNRWVNDYLAQAGIANAQLHHVAKAFLSAERAFGPAPSENTSALNAWEDDAACFLPHGLTIPRMVLEVDETAHYAYLFTRFRQQEKPRNSFEELFFEEITKAQNEINSGLYRPHAIPKPSLVWGHSGLALAIPKLEGRLTISVEGQTRRLRGGQSWPLVTPWPEHIDWCLEGRSDRIAVFPNQRHLLIFDPETGRLITSIDSVPSNDLVVDAREIVLVSVTPFSVNGEAAFSVGYHGYSRYCLLGSQTISIEADWGVVKLTAKQKPRIWIENGTVAKGPRGYLLSLGAVLGIELGDGTDETFDLALSVGDRQEIVTLSRPPGLKHLIYQIANENLTSSALVSVKAELRLSGSNRALVRQKMWLWPGLRSLIEGVIFDSDSIPDNYSSDQSSHLTIDHAGRLCLDAESAYETARLSFFVDGERVEFALPRPGISTTYVDVEGRSVPLRIGEPLIVLSEDKGGSLIVRCPDRDASLNIRGRFELHPFKQSPSRVLSLADLTSPASRDEITLYKHSCTGIPILLTRIVPTLAPHKFEARDKGDHLSLRLTMRSSIDAVRLSVEDETGARQDCDCALTHREVPNFTPRWFQAELDVENTRRILVNLSIGEFDGNLSLAKILVRQAGDDAFRPVRNARGDNYALVLNPPDQKTQRNIFNYQYLESRFATVNSWMCLCFSRESWNLIGQRIQSRWTQLGSAIAEFPEGSALLLASAHLPRLPGTARSWVPLAHPLQILPSLYGPPARSFRSLASGVSEGAEHLALLAETEGKTIPEIHQAIEISPAFLMAFDNFLQAQQTNEELRGFDFSRYNELFVQFDTDTGARWFWQPGDKLLGPEHYGAALGRLIDRLYEAGLEEEGSNNVRIQTAMALCNEAYRSREKTPPVPHGIETSHALIERVPAFLSGFARASRRGAADEYLHCMSDRLGRQYRCVIGDAAFLIRLAPELFAFFLLMRELESERSLT